MLEKSDPQVHQHVKAERKRQQTTLNMIPSENYVSKAILECCGTVLMNKYSEGYPFKRYYEGNEHADQVEALAIERAKKLFGAEHANVQPYSGSPANMAVYHALLEPGDTILGMRLDMGGHLTHGHKVNFSSKYFNAVQYAVQEDTHLIDLDEVRQLALEHKPKIIVSGSTAYPRLIDFKAFQSIADEIGAVHLADISHIAGLVAGGAHPSPFPFTDIVMTTTHKTLRGPRGAIIMCKEKFAKKIDRAVFPGLQGGPHDNIIAAKAVAFQEAMSVEFKSYAHQIVANARALTASLNAEGIQLVTGGTENHLLLIDLRSKLGIGMGKKVSRALDAAGIVTNCNTVPYDPSTPFKPSGVRLGTPILTTRGMKEEEMKLVGQWIAHVVNNLENEELHKEIRHKVEQLCVRFPVYEE